MIKRRDFLALGAATLAAPLLASAARAQQVDVEAILNDPEAPVGSPSARVLRARHAGSSIPVVTNRTDPSPNSTFTPFAWLLRAALNPTAVYCCWPGVVMFVTQS